jgi:hypothetical protein
MGDANSEKPIVILCLDDPLATDVAAALPKDVYDVRFAQAPTRGGRPDADAYEAQQIVEANPQNPGFVITDESTTSSLSGASLSAGAGRKGWHTLLRSGSNKSKLAIMADRYLSGEFNGEKNVEQIVSFIRERTDETGQVIPKNRLPEMLHFDVALKEFEDKLKPSEQYPDGSLPADKREMALSMLKAYVKEIGDGIHDATKEKLADPRQSRAIAQRTVNEVIGYLDNSEEPPRHLNKDTLERLASASKPLTAGEELQQQFKEDPQAFHERAIEEVRRREIVGDEPPGATEEFIAHVKSQYPDFRTPEEHEIDAIKVKTFVLKEEERKASRAKGGWARAQGEGD